MKSKYTPVTIMVAAAIGLFAIGFLVLRQRAQQTYETAASKPSDQTQQQSSDQTQPAPANDAAANWSTYSNSKYAYQVKYPPTMKAGAVSDNSALGTAQSPVKGYHVGPLVFVTLKGALRQQGASYFQESYNLALHPVTPAPGESPVTCTIDKINNPNVTVQSVSCNGEGGPERYALIKGSDYDIFVDGYTGGYDNVDPNPPGRMDVNDYTNILASFQFTSAAGTQNTTTQTTTTAPPPNPAPVQAQVQSFTITADDSGAAPAEITVAKGTIVDLTFSVSSSNVYKGGLDFRSSVVNSGTIYAGSSKTVAFTATQSFSFTPYWPASNVAKPYTIRVTVQ